MHITILTSSSFKIESNEPIDEDRSERLKGSKDKLHTLCLVVLCPARRFGGNGGGELFRSVFFNHVLNKNINLIFINIFKIQVEKSILPIR